MNKNLLTLLCLLWVGTLFAQNRTITGKVIAAEDGSALPGVSILLKGSSTGTTTDFDGNYSISVPNSGTLVFSYIGFLNKEVAIGNQSIINVSLESDVKALSEVIVVGYGVQERRDLTGSVGTIKGSSFQNVAIPSFDKFLQGQATGVQASAPSGILGQPARVRIRGTNSISNSAEPLYVVDGLPYVSGDQGAVTPYNPLGDINPNDIESVEVLKDGSATAIYGSRAANGVILITTKKGKQGSPKVNYDAWFAAAKPSKRFDLMNAEEFIKVNNMKAANSGVTQEMARPTPVPGTTNEFYDTDWQDVVFRTGFQQNHSLSLSGATPATNYYFSLGFTDLEGISQNNDQRRYSLRANIEQKALNNNVTFGINSSLTHTTDGGLNTNENGLSGNVASVIVLPPNVPVKWPDGTYNLNSAGTALGSGANQFNVVDNRTNLQFIFDQNKYLARNLNFTGNAYGDIRILDGLNFRSQLGLMLLNGSDFQYWNPEHGDGRGNNGYVYNVHQNNFRWNWVNTITYNTQIDDHKIGFVGGYEAQKNIYRWYSSSGIDLAHPYFGEKNIISGTIGTQYAGGSYEERAFNSVFGRLNYSFKDRYLVTGTLRHDKISSLPWGNQGATLPGISLGWRLSNEDFFKNSAALRFIDDLKIRGGWAEVGNVEIGAFPYAGIYAPRLYGSVSGLYFNQVGNPGLTFETSKKINFGIDVSLFNNRIGLVADYFKNDVDNLILAIPVPPSHGVPSNQINSNIGALQNTGWEFAVRGDVIRGNDFNWSANLNITFVQNEIVKLAGAPIVDTYHKTDEGMSIGHFFGYEYYGVNPANGFPVFVKGDGTLAQIHPGNGNWSVYKPGSPEDISESTAPLNSVTDKKYLGHSNPTWFGGFNNTFTYKNFDLSLFLTFAGGHKVYNRTRQENGTTQQYANGYRELLNAWTPENRNTDVPILWAGQTARINQTNHLNSRFLEDGKFLRAQNITLGYRIPKTVTERLRIENVRIYGQIQNAFVLTKYTGVDPELGSSVTTNRQASLDYNINPVPRTFLVGINLGF